jgi:glucose-6-phosphate 1-dehydrogenase
MSASSAARLPDPATVVIFGATGDLTHRKVLPALYNLRRAGLLAPTTAVLAFARRPFTDSTYREEARRAVAEHSRVPLEPAVWDEMARGIYYQRGDFDQPAAYAALAKRLAEIDRRHGTQGNRLIYLATPPAAFLTIVANLGQAGLDVERRGRGWARVILEKPFGHDLASARQLNREVSRVFRESQCYRIDHYLGKETVRNILAFRFGNGIFEPVWNRRYVDHVQISVAESMGVGTRGPYYEGAGATRDILQNHALQLLGLMAMEPPIAFDAEDLRNEKLRVLKAVDAAWTAERVARDVVRGQYGRGEVQGAAVPAYREEPGVASNSRTETYVAAKLAVENWRWAGVPFYVRTGKRLAARFTEIAVEFRCPPLALFRTMESRPEPNVLVMRIQPGEGIALRFVAKVPGLGFDVRSVEMDFTHGSSFQADAPEAYETLLLDALLGDASLFTRADEVEAAWEIVDPINQAWAAQDAAGGLDCPIYPAGSWGPPEADALLARDGRRWRRPAGDATATAEGEGTALLLSD